MHAGHGHGGHYSAGAPCKADSGVCGCGGAAGRQPGPHRHRDRRPAGRQPGAAARRRWAFLHGSLALTVTPQPEPRGRCPHCPAATMLALVSYAASRLMLTAGLSLQGWRWMARSCQQMRWWSPWAPGAGRRPSGACQFRQYASTRHPLTNQTTRVCCEAGCGVMLPRVHGLAAFAWASVCLVPLDMIVFLQVGGQKATSIVLRPDADISADMLFLEYRGPSGAAIAVARAASPCLHSSYSSRPCAMFPDPMNLVMFSESHCECRPRHCTRSIPQARWVCVHMRCASSASPRQGLINAHG
jgi:hypothetical protein